MSSALHDFLSVSRVTKGDDYTHTSFKNPAGAFYIPASRVDAFLDVYTEAVKSGEQLSLTEKHRYVGPVVVDLDFRVAPQTDEVQQPKNSRLYTPAFVEAAVCALARAIAEYVVFPPEGISVYVLEKPWTGATPHKDGLHLVVPDIVTRPAPQYLMREYLLGDPSFLAALDALPVALSNKPSDVLDEAVIERNNWLMYGSSKPGSQVYRATRVFKFGCEPLGVARAGAGGSSSSSSVDYYAAAAATVHLRADIVLADSRTKKSDVREEQPQQQPQQQQAVTMDIRKLVETLSIRNKTDESSIRPDRAEQIATHQYNLDDLRLKRDMARSVLLETAAANAVGQQQQQQQQPSLSSALFRNSSSSGGGSGALHPDFDVACALVRLLSAKRAEAYPDWIRVGWCLHNIDPERLLPHWVEFSRKSADFIEGDCEKFWHNMRPGGLGVGTLRMWAKQDSPQQYAVLMRDILSNLLHRSASGTHNDVAQVVHQMYKHEFVCASMRNGTWYEFKSHRWHLLDMGQALRVRLSQEVYKEYLNAASACLQLTMRLTEDSEQKAQAELSKKLMSVAEKLKCSTFKEYVMRECKELFYVAKFEDLLDASPDLLCFENGVYDLSTGEFRDGRPEDHVSFCTHTTYVPYDPDHELTQEVLRFWEQVFPDAPVRNYVMTLLASFMSGVTRDERFHVWTGTGSNGKSKVIELYEKTFGDYCCKLPITLLTQRRAASNAATSEVSRTKGKRLGVLQEPSEDERLNVGLMKELTGGDRIVARPLYREPIEFKPMFKLVLLCNHLPSVPSDDGGTWRRIRVVAFKSKFVDNPNPEKENEFPIDVDLPQKFAAWAPYFASIMIEQFKRYLAVGRIREPEEVMEHTREYQRNNDHYTDFVDTKLSAAEGGFLTVEDAYHEFKEWVREDRIPLPNIRKRDFKASLEKILGKAQVHSGTGGFKSWQLKQQ